LLGFPMTIAVLEVKDNKRNTACNGRTVTP
jgi:hypothetical protein